MNPTIPTRGSSQNSTCITRTEIIAHENDNLAPNEKERVENHLKSCQDCFAELLNIRNLSRAVAYYYKNLPKGDDCLDQEMWVAYLDGKITGSEHENIKDHLTDCDHCFDLVSTEIGIRGRRKVPQKWWIEELMTQVKGEAERLRNEAKQSLQEVGNWLQTLFYPPLQPAMVRTRGSIIRARQKQTVVEAEVLDENNRPTGATVPFTIQQGPEVDSERRFRLQLYTPSEKYVGYMLDIALQKDNKTLTLCAIPLQSGEVKKGKQTLSAASAEAVVELAGTDVRIYKHKVDIPLSYLKLSLIPAEHED